MQCRGQYQGTRRDEAVLRLQMRWRNGGREPLTPAVTGTNNFSRNRFLTVAQFQGTCCKASGWTLLGHTQGHRHARQDFFPPPRPPQTTLGLRRIIVQERGADYLFTVKGNQKGVADTVRQLHQNLSHAFSPSGPDFRRPDR